MNKVNKPTEKFNVQKMSEEIHAQYGTSEMANYQILLMCDKIENRAFEAGRQSVIDNLLDLKWEDEYAWHFAMALGVKYSINENDGKFLLYANRVFVGKLNSLEQAKRVAFFNYKDRIKKALGL